MCPAKPLTFPPVKWRGGGNKKPAPFDETPGATALRLAFHSESFQGLPPQVLQAVVLLKSLCRISRVKLSEVGGQGEAEFEIGELVCPPMSGSAAHGEGRIAVPAMQVWRPLFEQNLADERLSKRSLTELLRDHFIVRANLHDADLFITGSKRLLRLQNKMDVEDANLVNPRQAAAIAGLYLRSHGSYCVGAESKRRFCVPERLFYWVLARLWLKDTWPLMSCCESAKCKGGEAARGFASGILQRCSGALRARDLVLRRLYEKKTQDSMATAYFHFEHLCLLLSGAFDSLASLVALACSHEEALARWPSFRDDEFLRAVRPNVPADLRRLSLAPRFHDLLTLLYEPRNMVHTEGLSPVTVIGRRSGMYHQIDAPMFVKIRSAAGSVGSCEEWGLYDDGKVDVFRYSQTLTKEALGLLNEIMKLLHVEMLFDNNRAPRGLPEGPPEDDIYGPPVGDNICILGGAEPPLGCRRITGTASQ
jgi:hypothetical protein